MVLVIDVGNTRIKSAVFENNTIINSEVFASNNALESIKKILNNFPKVEFIVVSSVGKLDKTNFEALHNKVKIHFVDSKTFFPFQNKYETPSTLGADRAVLASGAKLMYPDKNCLIIDAGTCVTYDFIDSEGNYYGGAISPGFRLRYEAMHNYTAKLPLLTLKEPEKVIGNNTLESMHSGVVNGLTFEIDGYIEHLRNQYENFIIILTGGDANFLAKRLKNTIFANSNFLLESLNHLFQYQINNV